MNDANHVVPAAVQLANPSASSPTVAYGRRVPVIPDVVCTHRFEAPCDELFDSWVDPSILARWSLDRCRSMWRRIFCSNRTISADRSATQVDIYLRHAAALGRVHSRRRRYRPGRSRQRTDIDARVPAVDGHAEPGEMLARD